MKEIKRLTPFVAGRLKHSHVVFIGEDAPAYYTSEDDGHRHLVRFVPPNPGGQDPQTGQMIEPSPGGWEILPAEDGHTHDDFEDIEVTQPKKKGSDEEIAKEIYSLVQAGSEVWCDSFDRAEESEEFYCGKQWEEGAKNALAKVDRAAVTINWVQKNIHELCGQQRENRSDLKFMPQEGGDQRVADLLNHVSKHVLERCFYEREESKVFEDQAVTGLGFFNLFVDFDDDLQGEIKVERFPWRDVILGPCEKEDLSDCEYLIKHKMYSKAKLKQLFGNKADKIEKSFLDWELLTPKEHTTYQSDQYANSENTFPVTVGRYPMVDVAKKEFRVLECWQRIYKTVPVIVKPDEDFYLNAVNWKKADLDAVATIEGAAVVNRTVPLMRVTRICGNVVLSDENPADLAANDFFLVPAWGEKRGGKFWGKVEAAKDPQREINQRASQAIDIGNKMAAYNWFIDEGTFADEQEYQRFKSYSSMPGAVFRVNSTQNLPIKSEGVKFPGELVNMQIQAVEQVNSLMNITVVPQGANDSGAKLIAMQKMKMAGNEFLFDNLSFAKKKMGRLLVSLIQRYYSPDRIYRIVSNANKKQELMLAGQPFSEFSEEEIQKLLADQDLSRYDVVVTETNHSPTVRLGNFVLLSEMAKSGLPVPPDVLMELADMPEEIKGRIVAGIQQQMQQGQQQEQSAKTTEVEKTLIGQGIIPEKTQQELGVRAGLTPEAMQNSQVVQNQIPQGSSPQQPQQSDANQMQMVLGMMMEWMKMQAQKPRKKVGRIVRDPLGNAQIELDEVDDEVMQ